VGSNRFFVFFGVAMIGLIVAGSLAGIVTPRGIGLDFANFYDAGHKALSGQFDALYDPFATIAGQPPLGNMTFFSLPITSYLFAPLARFEPQTALILFKVQSTAFLWAGLVALYFHLRRLAGDEAGQQARFFALFTGAALLFQPFWAVYRVGGQTTPLVFLLLVIGLISFSRARFWAAALCYVLVVLVKPVFAPGLILLFLYPAARFRIASLVLSLGAAAGSFVWLGWDVHIAFLEKLANQGSDFVSPYYNSNMFTWVEVLMQPGADFSQIATLPGGVRAVALALRLLAIAGLLVMLVRLNRSDATRTAKLHFTFIIGMLLPMVFSPVVWGHYLAVFFVPLAYMLAMRRYFPTLAMVGLGVAVAFSFFQNLVVVVKIDRIFGLDTWPEVFWLTSAKSVTMLLVVGVMLIWSRQYLGTYRDDTWGA
jgi:Glycosyltransferase family 87